MEKHTQKGLKTIWSKETASARARREYSSAPTTDEMRIYEKWAKKAIKNKKSPHVLVLGATPELRDLALKCGAGVLAVDISWDNLNALTQIMKHQNNADNLFMKCDWLKMDKFIKKNQFDLILGDICLNNVPIKKHLQLLKTLNSLLKPNGYFVTRNIVFIPEKPKRKAENIFKDGYKENTTWLGMLLELGYYGPEREKIYKIKTKKFIWGNLFDYFDRVVKENNFPIRKKNLQAIEFGKSKGKWDKAIHIVFSKKEFEKLLGRYFKVVNIEKINRYSYSEFVPIYVLKKR